MTHIPKVVNCRFDLYDVYIGRPSKWGNPYSHMKESLAVFKVSNRREAIYKYEIWLKEQPKLMADLHELKGKVLGCWCAPKSCHGDVLLRLANDNT